jgi:hypothetical protein
MRVRMRGEMRAYQRVERNEGEGKEREMWCLLCICGVHMNALSFVN